MTVDDAQIALLEGTWYLNPAQNRYEFFSKGQLLGMYDGNTPSYIAKHFRRQLEISLMVAGGERPKMYDGTVKGQTDTWL